MKNVSHVLNFKTDLTSLIDGHLCFLCFRNFDFDLIWCDFGLSQCVDQGLIVQNVTLHR